MHHMKPVPPGTPTPHIPYRREHSFQAVVIAVDGYVATNLLRFKTG